MQTIAFARSRTAVEVLTTYLRETFAPPPGHPHTIRGYRGGYLPNERHEIEAGLRDGRVRGVVATNALELGIDIGSLDAAISIGYPGTIASTWQQMGRCRPAGRNQPGRAGLLVCADRPVPGRAPGVPVRHARPSTALINPDNLHVLLNHLRASTFELPVPAAERFGIEETPTLLDVLEEDGYVRRADDDRYYWSHENFPASDFSLRSGAPENVVIVDTTGDRHRVLGEVDLFAAPLLVHEKAIYIHEGVQHHVDRLDWDERKAYVTRTDVDYYTDADLGITLKVLEVFDDADRACRGQAAARRGDGRLEGDHVQEAQVPHPRERRLGLDQHPRAGDAHHCVLARPAGGAREPIRPRHAGRSPDRPGPRRPDDRFAAADVRSARPRRAGPGPGALHRASRPSTCTTQSRAASA